MAVNRLAGEKSPYLLQHAHNPVDWYPWGPEAFAEARAEDKPIFLSVGYATCHWCHVMAHETFEDQEAAAILNELFVSIKVDREERPDVDQVYMAACQALTGQGGWPLSVFLAPDGQPFYAGTYFPKTSRFGRPGFIDLIKMLAEKYRTEKEVVLKAAEQLTQVVRGADQPTKGGPDLGENTLHLGFRQLAQRFDGRWGGFGSAPKFPTPHNLSFLLRWQQRRNDSTALSMVEKTLTAMRLGGIFDHIGLGFHRYSVDEQWLVPHFEKMLYDQALLALAYLETFQVTGGELYARTAAEIFSYVLRDMTSPGGGFYTAEDADSDGEEGLFYVWRPEEIETVLGAELGGVFNQVYGIVPEGNFEKGLSIPHLEGDLRELAGKMGLDPESLGSDLARARQQLYEHREKRNKPLKDDKILTAWNGLMIAALARGAQVLGDGEYARAATRAADFILENLSDGQGGLLRRYRDNQADFAGYLEDYAFLVWGLLELYETVFEVRYLKQALALTRIMLDQFLDQTGGGLYFTGDKNETLITRKKEVYDGAIPSGNSVALMNLLRLGRLTGETGLEEEADRLIKALAHDVGQYPSAHTHFLMGLDWAVGPTREIVVAKGPAGGAGGEMIKAVHRTFLPRRVLMVKEVGDAQGLAGLAPLVQAMEPVGGLDTFFLCQGYACQSPLTNLDEVQKQLADQG